MGWILVYIPIYFHSVRFDISVQCPPKDNEFQHSRTIHVQILYIFRWNFTCLSYSFTCTSEVTLSELLLVIILDDQVYHELK